MMIVGSVAVADDDHFAGKEFLEPEMFRAGAILLIVVGIIIAFFSFLGCYGALKENSCFLMTVCFIHHLH